MSLPKQFVERIFARMLVRYGAAWLRMWEGVDLELVKEDWSHELGGFERNTNAIKHALEHLPPGKPPNVSEFRDICLRAPVISQPALPGPKPDLERAKELIASAFSRAQVPHGKEWAMRLMRRVANGERLPSAHVRMARQALGEE